MARTRTADWEVYPNLSEKPDPLFGQQCCLLIEFQGALCDQALGNGHTKAAGNMVVASSRSAQGSLIRAGCALLHLARHGYLHDPFQHPRYVWRSQPMKPLPPLFFHF
jgi:hypothetical protein